MPIRAMLTSRALPDAPKGRCARGSERQKARNICYSPVDISVATIAVAYQEVIRESQRLLNYKLNFTGKVCDFVERLLRRSCVKGRGHYS